MAYEAERLRLAGLLTETVQINRLFDPALEREAAERAFEARQQTGLSYTGTSSDFIAHPPAEERRDRLGVPISVGTAELATWNYLWHDPVQAAATGLLNSTPHRQVLDNPLYTHWGVGIYTEMPQGEDNELFRRWWFIIWLATQAIEEAALLKPSEIISPPEYVGFANATYWGYKFDYNGKVLDAKKLTLSRPSRADAKGRAHVPNRSGTYLLMSNGFFADYWIPERGFMALPDAPKLV